MCKSGKGILLLLILLFPFGSENKTEKRRGKMGIIALTHDGFLVDADVNDGESRKLAGSHASYNTSSNRYTCFVYSNLGVLKPQISTGKPR